MNGRARDDLRRLGGVKPPTLTMALYSPREWPATTSRRVGAALFEHGVDRGRDREDRRLRVLGELELIVGTFEAELRDRKSERGVDVVEDAARGRETSRRRLCPFRRTGFPAPEKQMPAHVSSGADDIKGGGKHSRRRSRVVHFVMLNVEC